METNRLSSKDRRRKATVTVEVMGAEKACVIIVSVMIISVMIISVIELVSSKDERRYK